MPRLPLPLLTITFFALPAAAQEGTGTSSPLFSAHDPIEATLVADFKEVFSNRDTSENIWNPAVLRWTRDGRMDSLPVELRTRGNFRLKLSTCSVPPLRIRFPKEGTEGTVWEGQGSVKLGTHCKDKYDELVMQEYMVYRLHSLFTDQGYRARPLRLTWVDTREPEKAETYWAFLIERDEELGDRLGGKVIEEAGLTFEIAEKEEAALMSVFQYMIGNTDWSMRGVHNVKALDKGMRYYPIPFDFDWSGLVNAPYARPDYRLGTRSVRERVWRGPCMSQELTDLMIAKFSAKRAEVEALYQNQEGLEPKARENALKYLGEFFKLLENPRNASRELRRACP